MPRGHQQHFGHLAADDDVAFAEAVGQIAGRGRQKKVGRTKQANPSDKSAIGPPGAEQFLADGTNSQRNMLSFSETRNCVINRPMKPRLASPPRVSPVMATGVEMAAGESQSAMGSAKAGEEGMADGPWFSAGLKGFGPQKPGRPFRKCNGRTTGGK